MKIKIVADEVYPVYHLFNLYDGYGDPTEVPNDLLKRWVKVFQEFIEIQDEIAVFMGYADGYPLDLTNLELEYL